jgi:hypothetical protein
MSKLNGKELANELTNFVNNFNCDHDEFINAFIREHRTLQQSSFRLFLMLMEKMASEEYGKTCDGRNKGSHEVAKKLVKGFRELVIMEQTGMSVEEAERFADSEYAKPHRYLGYV